MRSVWVLASLQVGLALIATLLAIWGSGVFSLAHCTDCKVLVFSVARALEPATRIEVAAMLGDAREHFAASFKTITKHAG